MSLCFISQALFCEMPSWRDRSREERPLLAWVIRCMARNQTSSASLESANSVQYPVWPHSGQTKPRGQRQPNSACSHCSRVPYRAMNSRRLMPRRNCTWFFGIAQLL